MESPRQAESSAGQPARYRLRILSQNLWHGLDHTQPYVMFPLENPLAGWLRTQAQKAALRALVEEPTPDSNEEILQVFCFQELNPVSKRLKDFKNVLGMEGHAVPINVGVRAGRLSYPFFLQEGLGIFWRGALEGVEPGTRILSGHATEFNAPLINVPIAFQFAERRGAILVSGTWHGKRFTFANLHLHHGAPNQESTERRSREIDSLMEWLDPWIQQSDAVFVAGDFNCEHGAAELSSLTASGFEEILSARGEPVVTWDPVANPIARENSRKLDDPIYKEWDERRHQIDHIFYRVKGLSWANRADARPPWTFRIQRVLDAPTLGAWPSDHFGLLVDVSWAAR